ncbi:AMP-binding protein [Streptomyces filamentosus]|uniref:AMP-binding protein n=1 Tax=Streptomyces filamentosus TaxID=67294 RepID=UPI001BA63117|nr:AMP-binding protein [Streptomyces filamentosus]
MTNLVVVLVGAARRCPQEPAVRVGGAVLGWADLDEASARVAGGLLAHGVRPGDRVGLRLPDVPAFPVLFLGALRAGAVVVPLSPRPWSLAVRPRGEARGARLVFAAPGSAGAGGGGVPGDTAYVPVGADFLAQSGFWPQHPGVVDRPDDAPAVMAGPGEAPTGPWGPVLGHGVLRAGSVPAPGAPGPVPSFSPAGRTYGLAAAYRVLDVLAAARASGKRASAPPDRLSVS